jgi:hypothetical protein
MNPAAPPAPRPPLPNRCCACLDGCASAQLARSVSAHRQVHGLRAFEDFSDIHAALAKQVVLGMYVPPNLLAIADEANDQFAV